MAVTSPSSRARLMISRPAEAGPPSLDSTKTQTDISDHLLLLEELDDGEVGRAVVFDLAAGFPLRSGVHAGDLLGRPGFDAEVGEGQCLQRLLLGIHDPLEGGLAGLDDPRGTRETAGRTGVTTA